LAIVRAEHGGGPVTLTTQQRSILDEALREGEGVREDLESVVMRYGRWLLDKVFGGNSTEALDDKTNNPVWRELVRRAGGPTLGVSRHLLYTAVRIAANDKRILDRTWRGLDVGRKELLLPLGTGDRLREGAHHVSQFNLTQSKTKEYVTAVLASQGKPQRTRLTPATLLARVRKARESLGGRGVLAKVKDLHGQLDPAAREAAARDLEQLRAAIDQMVKLFRRR
jgi:hypothetical protein